MAGEYARGLWFAYYFFFFLFFCFYFCSIYLFIYSICFSHHVSWSHSFSIPPHPPCAQLQHVGEQARYLKRAAHNRVSPVSTDISEPTLKLWPWEIWPYFPFAKTTLQLLRPRSRIMPWPTPTSTPYMIFWSTWKGLTHRPKAEEYAQHKTALGHPGRVLVKTHCFLQGVFFPVLLCYKYVIMNVNWMSSI